ncbi:MAG: hypothetical protein O7I93_10020 [Gemmatimonadetes bacterium]|nr:hypothetical protein [Gemmatimonadota bacterium]
MPSGTGLPAGCGYTAFTGLPEEEGVVYGINGVCHQIANRLLYRSGRIVSHAEGYWFSISLFGTYGTQVAPTAWLASTGIASAVAMSVGIDWQSRMKWCGPQGEDQPLPGSGGLSREALYIRRVQALRTGLGVTRPGGVAATSYMLHARELDLLIAHRLGADADSMVLRALRALYRDYFTQRFVRAEAGPADDFDATGVAAAMNAELHRFAREIGSLLGDEVFARLFGFPPDREIPLISSHVLDMAGQALE